MAKDGPSNWKLVSEELVTDHFPICKVYNRKMHHHERGEGNFFIIKSADWVQAIAITTEKKLIMVKQFRFGSQKFSLEVPGGILEEGEDPIVGAARELSEETGFEGVPKKIIRSCYPNPAIQTNKVHFVLIEDCKLVKDTNWDRFEELETSLIDLKDLDSLINSNAINHSITLNALLLLKNL